MPANTAAASQPTADTPDAATQAGAAVEALQEMARAKMALDVVMRIALMHVQGLEAVRASMGERPPYNDLIAMRCSCLGFVCRVISGIDPELGRRMEAALFPDADRIDYSNQGAGTPDLEAIYDRLHRVQH
jgi:hypothetical protein